MLQIPIILLFVSGLLCIHGPSTAKNPSNEFQTVTKQEIIKETEQIKTQLKKKASATFSTKKDGEGTQILNGCFGGLDRWLSLTSKKKKDKAKQQGCYCECYKKMSKEGSIGFQKINAAELEKCCSHIKAAGCDRCADQGTTGRKVEMVGTAEDFGISTLRLTNSLAEVRHGTAEDPVQDATAGNVQLHNGRGSRWPKRGRRRTVKIVARKGEQCCCEKCYENCFLPSYICCCGLPLMCLVKTCQCGCDHLFRCLAKYCNC